MMQKIGVTGQESMSRLLLAPFTFIAPSELNSLADLLVSAISFLEGNSSDDVETFVDIEASSSNQVVANFGLTLVPYKSSLDVESSPKITPRITFDSKTRFSSNFVLSRKPAVEPGQPTVRLDEYFKDLYQVDREMSAALRAAEVNNAEYILDAAFETGLNTSDETLLFVLSKMTRTGAQYENSGLLKKIIQHMELEHNTEPTIIGCAVLPDSGPMGHPPSAAHLV
ncbi:hypothetical protein ADEAN_000274800 [Angomonas deanei]|uniref:Uncharacterized protein n=1 Tax=Angomonas deanei TaxID=59799 RepID=A0A7G2C952_9TRYP|nr:hypothetical protein ADEAN_000274800 [Angomonas deanei]